MDLGGFATAIVENASSSLLESLEGLQAEDVWAQVAPDANPIAWMVGHCACHLDGLQSQASGAPRLIAASWAGLHRPGIVICEVLPHLAPFADIAEAFLRAREAAVAALSSASREELEGKVNEQLEENVVDSAKRVGLHLSLHLGQVLLVRKLRGKPCAPGFFRLLKPNHREGAMKRWKEWWAQNKRQFDVNPYAQPAKGI